MNLESIQCDALPDGYEDAFFESLLSPARIELEPCVWYEGDEAFRIFTTVPDDVITAESVRFFRNLQEGREKQKIISFFANRPLSLNDELMRNDDHGYVKISMIKNSPFVFNEKSVPCTDYGLEMREGYHAPYHDQILKLFPEDRRFVERDARVKALMGHDARLYHSFAQESEHLYFAKDERLISLVSVMQMDQCAYHYAYKLISLIWIAEGLDDGVKRGIMRSIFDWLNLRKAPFSGGILYENKRSIKSAARNAFEPYFCRFIPWGLFF